MKPDRREPIYQTMVSAIPLYRVEAIADLDHVSHHRRSAPCGGYAVRRINAASRAECRRLTSSPLTPSDEAPHGHNRYQGLMDACAVREHSSWRAVDVVTEVGSCRRNLTSCARVAVSLEKPSQRAFATAA
jgi:hypothetical protein